MTLVSGDTKPPVVHSWCWPQVAKIIPDEWLTTQILVR